MVAEELRLSETQQVQARELVERVESLWHDTIRDIGQVSAAELDRRFVERSQLNAADLKALLSPDRTTDELLQTFHCILMAWLNHDGRIG